MLTRGQRFYNTISTRYGEFFSYSNTGRSAWVRMEGDMSITCVSVDYLLPEGSPQIEVAQKRQQIWAGGIPWEEHIPHLVLALMVSE